MLSSKLARWSSCGVSQHASDLIGARWSVPTSLNEIYNLN